MQETHVHEEQACVARTAIRGVLLARSRKAAGWTQAQLAAQLGAAGRLRVGQWERGLEQPQPRYIPRLAAALHLDALELLDVDVQNPPLQALRLAAGLTLAEVAAASGMAYSTYYRLENGLVRANPHPETTEALAHTLGRGTTDILRAIAQTRLSRGDD